MTPHPDLAYPTFMAKFPVEWRIQTQKDKLQKLEEKIGRLMSERVDLEEELAALYEERNATPAGGGSTTGPDAT